MHDAPSPPQNPTADRLARPIVLVGLMGAGKTAVGKRLARDIGARFADSDDEVEKAAGMSVADIFESYGEPKFRALERSVIRRLLEKGEFGVLALGGGAFMDPDTRQLVLERGFVVWLKAAIDVLLERTGRRPGKRPLLATGDPRTVLSELLARREPVYALAHATVISGADPISQVVTNVAAHVRQSGRPA